MSVAFGEPSLAVDTHVERVSKRLGINRWKDNVRQVEKIVYVTSFLANDGIKVIINSYSLEDIIA